MFLVQHLNPKSQQNLQTYEKGITHTNACPRHRYVSVMAGELRASIAKIFLLPVTGSLSRSGGLL